MPILTTQDLTIAFGGLRAVDQVNLEIEQGRLTSVIGPNGAGKTTLLIFSRASIAPLTERSFLTIRRLPSCPSIRS